MLTYTIPQFASEIGTDKANIYALVELGFIKTLTFGSKSRKITIPEAERFLDECRGQDFSIILEDYKSRKKLDEMQQKIYSLK